MSSGRRSTFLIIDPPPMNGGIRLEQLTPCPQHADAGRPQHLVPREGVEVRTQLGHVDRELRHRLRAVDEHRRAGFVGAASDLGDRVDRAQDIRDVRHARPASRLPVEQLPLQLARSSLPSRVDAEVLELGAGSSHSSCQGTTLEWCSISVISTMSPSATFCRAQVKRTRLIASVALRTNTVSAGRRADEVGDRCPRALVEPLGLGRELCMLRWTLALSAR